MKKTVLTFGLLSGAVSAGMMFATVPFIDRIGFDKGAIVGYTGIVLSFLLVFFGVRSYRENVGGGKVTFGRALAVGMLITLISCVCYVVAWEILYFNFLPDFSEKYASYAVARVKAQGGSEQAVEATRQQMEAFKKMYDNPLMNAGLTFLEPLPIGLVVAAISSVVLRKK
jgi:hypothetical protein